MYQIVDKPWGHEEIIVHTDKYVMKKLFIKQGQRLSRQFHKIKDETVYVVEGTLLLDLSKTDSENNLLSLMIISGLLVVTSFFLLLRFPPFARFCLILIVSGGLANLIDKIYNINATNIMCSVQQSSGIYSVCFNLADFFVIFGVIFGLVYNFYFFIRIVTKNNALRLISISPVFVLLHLWMFDWLISSF